MAPARKIEGLDCDAPASEGIRLTVAARLAEMFDLRDAALNWDDIEGVHDMRVASRRLRSVLRDFGDFIEGKGIPARQLRDVAAALGAVRDEDVAIAALGKLRDSAPHEVVAGLDQIIGERNERRTRARARLETAVGETPLAELRQKLLARLDAATGKGASVAASESAKGKNKRRGSRAISFRTMGREVVAARWTELEELSDSLHHPYEVEPLHRMRIAAKRLRYAVELFAPCWGGRIVPCVREIGELQSSLGDLHDCDIWIEDVGARLDHRRRRRRAAPDQAADGQAEFRLAAVWLLRHFARERERHYRRALMRWHRWEMNGFFARLTSLLEAQPAKRTPTDDAGPVKTPTPSEVAGDKPVADAHAPGEVQAHAVADSRDAAELSTAQSDAAVAGDS